MATPKSKIKFPTSADSPFEDGYDIAGERDALKDLVEAEEPDEKDPRWERFMDLLEREERLRQEIAQLRSAQATASVVARRSGPDDATLSRVQALIGESEERQRRELALRTAQVVRDLDAQRRDDLARVQATMGQIEGSTGAELRQQNRELWNFLMNNVSQRGTVR